MAQRKFPQHKWLRQASAVVLLHGASRWAPYNLSYYWPHVPVAFVSMIYLKKRFLGLWSKYNYVTSAALSAGVDIGQGIGLGQSCGSLGSDSILYQPVQFADGSDTSWSSDLAGQYQYSALSPPYA